MPDPPEKPPGPVEWSIWEQRLAELRRREREPATLHILADEPRDGFELPEAPSASVEWSIWDPAPPPLRRPTARDAAGSAGAHAGDAPFLVRRRARRLVGAVAATATTVTAAVALASVLSAPQGPSGPAPQRASSGLQANQPTRGSFRLATPPSSSRPLTSATHRDSRRKPAVEPKAKSTSKAPKLVSPGSGTGVPTTVQYHSAASQTPTAPANSSPQAEAAPTPNASSASASASHEFGFEH